MTDDIRDTEGNEQEDREKETYRKEDRRVRLDDTAPGEETAEEAAAAVADAAGDAPADEGAGPAAESAAAKDAADAAAQDEEAAMPPLDTRSLMRWCLGLFVEQAWVHMGLRLAPGAKELTTDLPQARMAIDTVAFLKDALGDDLDSNEKKEMEQVIATLRMNYVQRT